MKCLLVFALVLVSGCFAHNFQRRAAGDQPPPSGAGANNPNPPPEPKVVSLEFIAEQNKVHRHNSPPNGCPSRNPCLNGGECYDTDATTPTGHNYVCSCNGDYGGFVCGIPQPCNTCPKHRGSFYCVRTSLDTRGRYCYTHDATLILETPASTGNPHMMIANLLGAKVEEAPHQKRAW